MNTDKIYAETIVNEYAPRGTSKVVALKKLDRRAKLPATVFSYAFGIVGTLAAGVGMCLSMQVIGTPSRTTMAAGVVIGLVGFLAMAINYPIYRKLLETGKKKYAFEIMQLAKEISER
ncbi:MAG: dihydropteridine reductase [Clostridiales bacterium]|nr:dihydropteridine reductase [Clostridiales bacterium]